jgi:hypothetical protein
VTPAVEVEPRRCSRFGWTSLAAWALFGLVLETAHGFKLAIYLDDDLRHALLRLAHAHGVILALVVLAFGRASAQLYPEPDAARGAGHTGLLLRAGALAIPAGFGLSAIAPHEGDPGLAVVLVPAGAIFIVIGLARAASRAWRRNA